MVKTKKNNKAKAKVKVNDLSPKKSPKGARKAGKGQQDYLIVKMDDVLIS